MNGFPNAPKRTEHANPKFIQRRRFMPFSGNQGKRGLHKRIRNNARMSGTAGDSTAERQNQIVRFIIQRILQVLFLYKLKGNMIPCLCRSGAHQIHANTYNLVRLGILIKNRAAIRRNPYR